MSIDYVLAKDEDGDVIACYACGEDVPTAEFDDRRELRSFLPVVPIKQVRLCDVCSSSRGGTAFFYPKQMDHADVIHMIAACTNKILEALKK